MHFRVALVLSLERALLIIYIVVTSMKDDCFVSNDSAVISSLPFKLRRLSRKILERLLDVFRDPTLQLKVLKL